MQFEQKAQQIRNERSALSDQVKKTKYARPGYQYIAAPSPVFLNQNH
jgi:hypothetical protein